MSIVQSDLGKGCLHINAPVVLAGLQWRSVYRSFAGRRGVPGRHVCKGCTVRCRIHAAGLCKASARARPGHPDSHLALQRFGFQQTQFPAVKQKCSANHGPSHDYNRGPPTVWELVKFYIAMGLRILRQVQSPQWEQYYFPGIREVLWKTACVLMAMISLALIMSGMDSTFLRFHQKFFLKI